MKNKILAIYIALIAVITSLFIGLAIECEEGAGRQGMIFFAALLCFLVFNFIVAMTLKFNIRNKQKDGSLKKLCLLVGSSAAFLSCLFIGIAPLDWRYMSLGVFLFFCAFAFISNSTVLHFLERIEK